MRIRIAVALAAAAIVAPTFVQAQAPAEEGVARGLGVMDRPRPDYDPIGMRSGGLFIYPAVNAGVEWTDNVFNQDTGEVDDTVFLIEPEIRVESDWSRHELNLRGSLTKTFHEEQDSDDVLDYYVGGDARIDMTRDTYFTGALEHYLDHEERGSPDVPGTVVEPPEFRSTIGGIGATHRFNRLSMGVDGSYQTLDYDDVGLNGGGTLNNDDRDRDRWAITGRLGYDFSPGYQGFVEGTYNEVEYDTVDDQTTAGGASFKRDSSGYEALAGLAFDLGAVAIGETAIGYREQQYDAANLPDVSGLTYRAGIDWFVTEMTTVRAVATGAVEETTVSGASGYFSNGLGLGVDHELLRNVLLSGDVTYAALEYEGVSREDDIWQFELAGHYLINRHFRATLGYEFDQRESDAAGQDYDTSTVLLSLRAAL